VGGDPLVPLRPVAEAKNGDSHCLSWEVTSYLDPSGRGVFICLSLYNNFGKVERGMIRCLQQV
jgi:hypothetical protein